MSHCGKVIVFVAFCKKKENTAYAVVLRKLLRKMYKILNRKGNIIKLYLYFLFF